MIFPTTHLHVPVHTMPKRKRGPCSYYDTPPRAKDQGAIEYLRVKGIAKEDRDVFEFSRGSSRGSPLVARFCAARAGPLMLTNRYLNNLAIVKSICKEAPGATRGTTLYRPRIWLQTAA